MQYGTKRIHGKSFGADFLDQTLELADVDIALKGMRAARIMSLIDDDIDENSSRQLLVGLGGEINNQTYLSRIIDNVNEILKLEEDQKLDRKDLFTFIGQGKYRLRIIPDNIKVDEALLREFVNSPENQEYKSIVT